MPTCDLGKIEAVSLDFYNTLVCHAQGKSRGEMLMAYLEANGINSDPWEHQILYDVFERHDREYSQDLSQEEKQRYLSRFTERVFDRLGVSCSRALVQKHVDDVWKILGPNSLTVFPEVSYVLRMLRQSGCKLAVVSNWQKGLSHFCDELGIRAEVDLIITSAEFGVAKPNVEIFSEMCSRLTVDPKNVIHVGDSLTDDVGGAKQSGLIPVWLNRTGDEQSPDAITIDKLDRLCALLGTDEATSDTY